MKHAIQFDLNSQIQNQTPGNWTQYGLQMDMPADVMSFY